MESETPELSQEQVPTLKPIELRESPEINETKDKGGFFDRALQKLGFGKETEQSTQPAENAVQNSLIQSPDSEAHYVEDTAKLEETRRKIEEIKEPTWVKRKNEGLLEGKITSKPLS